MELMLADIGEAEMTENDAAIELASSPEIKIAVCPDCGMESSGAYCSNCGEEMEPALPPVAHYVRELLSEFLAFDSRVARTIPSLLFRPGFLTLEYIAGRRKRYLLPSRLYILIAFGAFFAISYYTTSHLQEFMASPNHGTIEAFNLHGKDAEAYLVAFSKLINSVLPYVVLLICAPLFAGYLKLLYRSSGRLFVEHLVFTLHLLTVTIVLMSPLVFIHNDILGLVLVLVLMVYAGLAFHKVYKDRGWKFAWHYTLSFGATIGVLFVAVVASVVIAYLIGVSFDVFPKAITNGAAHLKITR